MCQINIIIQSGFVVACAVPTGFDDGSSLGLMPWNLALCNMDVSKLFLGYNVARHQRNKKQQHERQHYEPSTQFLFYKKGPIILNIPPSQPSFFSDSFHHSYCTTSPPQKKEPPQKNTFFRAPILQLKFGGGIKKEHLFQSTRHQQFPKDQRPAPKRLSGISAFLQAQQLIMCTQHRTWNAAPGLMTHGFVVKRPVVGMLAPWWNNISN